MTGVMDEPENRDASGRFKPNTSGNPGGRPGTVSKFRAWLDENFIDEKSKRELPRREHLWARAFEIAMSGKATECLRAIEIIISHDMGKPVQAITGENGAPLFGQSELVIAALKKLAGE